MKPKLTLAALILLCLVRCRPDPVPPAPQGDLSDIPYHPTAYTIPKPAHFPQIPVPDDSTKAQTDSNYIYNPMTLEGVQLGRRLFYDPILSGDSTMSCSSCHLPEKSFTDGKAKAVGIDHIEGRRGAMSLLNVAYTQTGLFWDGRAPTLEAQAIKPVENDIELHTTWPVVVAKLKAHPLYPRLFRQAFGISDRSEITKELAARAIAQFERILISSGNTKYDRYKLGDANALDDEERAGLLMFFDNGNNDPNLPDGQCFHCHTGDVLLNGGTYFSNGIDTVASPLDFIDKGRGEVTGKIDDYGVFRVPTLRNISLTAPYMHDGRYATLEQVIEHYGNGVGTGLQSEGPFLSQIGTKVGSKFYLNAEQKANILKFLKALDDPDFIANPDIQSPF